MKPLFTAVIALLFSTSIFAQDFSIQQGPAFPGTEGSSYNNIVVSGDKNVVMLQGGLYFRE